MMDIMPEKSIDPREFRDALGHYASGITIIAGMRDERPVGFTCQSFYSVSMDPPLVSFSVMRTSSSWPLIRGAQKFSINVLSHHQQRISNAFARSGTDRWAGVDWKMTARGNPAISDTLIWLDCELYGEYRAGDHDIVIGHVHEMSPIDMSEPCTPLVYFKGRYCHLRDIPPQHE